MYPVELASKFRAALLAAAAVAWSFHPWAQTESDNSGVINVAAADFAAYDWSLPDLPVLQALDVNADGVVDTDEIQASTGRLKALDSNGDEIVDAVELGGPGPMPGWLRLQVPIKVIDRDGDEQLSFAELETAAAALRRADRNGDWLLDNEELFDNRVKPKSVAGLAKVKPMLAILARSEVKDPILPGEDSRQFDGYMIYTESNTIRDTTIETGTKLLDANGALVHSWPAQYAPEGVNSYLLENGLLLRQQGIGDYLDLEGMPVASHGVIELVNWEGEVLWRFEHCVKNSICLHHDLEPLPNGNILVMEYIAVTQSELAWLGRTPRDNERELRWFERILELQPNLDDGTTDVVWIWNSLDHLVQDRYPDKPNYGNVQESADRFDINYPRNPERHFHFNGIDYHPELDQIVVTSVNHSELYILDHSTTTDEARTGTGGRYGKGGRVLFRWGNPAAYGMGAPKDAVLGGAHDPIFLNAEQPGKGHMTINNNRAGLITGAAPTGPFNLGAAYSSVVEIKLPLNDDGSYSLAKGRPHQAEIVWEYVEKPLGSWQSPFAGSASRLPNGNTIVMNSQVKRIFEVTESGERVLDFELSGTGRPQKVHKLPRDYPGLSGRNLP